MTLTLISFQLLIQLKTTPNLTLVKWMAWMEAAYLSGWLLVLSE